MSVQRTTTRIGISLLLFAVVCSLALAQSTTPMNNAPRSDSRLDRGREVLRCASLEIQHDYVSASVTRTVFIIGENHASSRAQKQVASLLERLLDSRAIDAVLVEGSAGPLNRTEFAEKIAPLAAELNPAGTAADYWRQQLNRGRIAGYEYVALARPHVDFYGVEDMVAKAKHDAQMFNLSAEDIEDECAFWERGEQKVAAAIEDQVGRQVPSREVDLCRTEHRRLSDALQAYRGWMNDLMRDSAQHRRVDREFRILQARALLQFEPLAEFYSWYEELERLASGPQSSASRARAAELQRKIERFIDTHERELLDLQETAQKLERLNNRWDEAAKKLEPLQEKVGEAALRLQDAYFIAANQVRAVAVARDFDFPELATFFRDETERREQEAQARAASAPELHQRDVAMAQNTVDRMKAKGYTTTALVVGKAHLKNIAAELTEGGVNVIGGPVSACEDKLRPWEETAWETRQAFATPIFAREGRRIPRSLLLNDVWKADEEARLRLLVALPDPTVRNLAYNGQIIEEVLGQNTALWTGRVFDHNAKVGEHVVASGEVHGQGRFFQLYDREAARNLVGELSRDGNVFVYVFQKRVGAKTVRRVFTPHGERSLDEFLREPPVDADGEPARRVIVCREPDEVHDQDLVESQFWQRLRNAGGGGSGRPPRGPWPPADGGADLPGSGRGIDIYDTINMRRAAEKLAILDHAKSPQGPQADAVRVVEEHDIPGLLPMFTPQRGDYGQMVFLLFDNTAELRKILDNNAQWFVNKQVGLITCGDAFAEAGTLREALLRSGAAEVWIPDTQIALEAARELKKRLEAQPPGQCLLPEWLDRIIEQWQREKPYDPNAKAFGRSRHHVRLTPDYSQGEGATASRVVPNLDRLLTS